MLKNLVSKVDKFIYLLWFPFGGEGYFATKNHVTGKSCDNLEVYNLYLTYAYKFI